MRRGLLSLLVVLTLVATAAPAVADDHDDRQPPTTTPGRDDRRSDDREERADDENLADDENRGRGRGRSDERTAAVGSFSIEAAQQQVDGDYVSFSYDDTNVRGFTVNGTHLFDVSVVAEAEDTRRDARARGAEVRIGTPHYALKVHDNPVAAMRLETEGVATLSFAQGVALQLDSDDVARFAFDGLQGRVRAEGLTLDGTTLTSSEDMLVFLDAPRGGFDKHRGEIGAAIAKRHVGAEASINSAGDGIVEDVVSYGNVTMTTMKAEKGNLTLLIDGHGFDGRVLVFNVDGRVVGASNAGDLHVLFDNETIAHADSIQDVLDPDDDGLKAEYYLVFDPATETFQVLLSLPHYSVHTLSIMTSITVPPPSVVAGILAGVLVLAASGFVLFRRPK